ncbi:MAG: hypothetical protein WCH52_10950, partial [Bacteroidota bacterium]
MKKNTYVFLFLITLFSNIHAQQNPNSYSLDQLKRIFNHANYAEKVLLDFQKTMINLRERPQLNEAIPGEVISWSTMIGEFSIQKVYVIEKNKLNEVEALPKDDSFLKKLNSYVPEKSKFTYSSDLWSFPYVYKKMNDNFYLIKATVKSFNSYPEIPNDDILLFNLEYKTKDFKAFR